ncbi:STAS domain-containing protein [Nocardia takedensis]|uniref:STAS domain-containing protein n=1 Tax=Nocardia takedensis TaxID=259390 RepID=UPI0002E9D881|nr:STAS domain-containing protein [Nocardia takedensis]
MSTVSITTRLSTTVSRQPGPIDRLQVSITEPGDSVTLCAVAGEVDCYTVEVLRARLIGAVDKAARTLVVDLSAVSFFGVVGLYVLFEAREQADGTRRRLRLVTGPRCVDRVLDVAGEPVRFERFPDLASAVLDRD